LALRNEDVLDFVGGGILNRCSTSSCRHSGVRFV
jgi:hypothetical protein